MSHADFCRERALEAQAEADRTPLANVHERCLRSVAAWEKMALRAEHVSRERLAREGPKLSSS